MFARRVTKSLKANTCTWLLPTLALCLAGAALTSVGCSENLIDPETSARTTELGLASRPTGGEAISSPSYFPLHDGDRWVYAVTESSYDEERGGQIVEVNITGSRTIGERQVYHLDNYMFPISDNQTEFFNELPGHATELMGRQSGLWYPWSQFGATDVRISIPEFGDDCLHGSQGMYVRLSTVRVPAGTFQQAATIRYDSTPCVDLGLAREVLAPEVGLIERTVTTFVGEVTWSLVYANVGGKTWGDAEAYRLPAAGLK